MDLFVYAARIIANLAGLGQQFAGLNDPKFTGPEYAAAIETNIAGDWLAPIAVVGYERVFPRLLFKMLSPAQYNSLILRLATPVAYDTRKAANYILLTLSVVDLLELTTGFGPPAVADDIKDDWEQWIAFYEKDQSAFPDRADWQGDAGKAYAGQETALQHLANTLVQLDGRLQEIVKDQADWVTHTRLGLGVLKDLLFAAFVVYAAIRYLPYPLGPLPARHFAVSVCVLGIVAALGLLTTLCTYSFLNARAVSALTAQYDELA